MIASKKLPQILSFLIFLPLLSGCTIGGTNTKGPDGGVWKSIDGGKSWTQIVAVPTTAGKKSIANVDIAEAVIDPQDRNTIYLATNNAGIVYTNDSGNSWKQFTSLNKGAVKAVAVDPQYKCNLYVISSNRLYRSNDCGRFWESIYYHQEANVTLTNIVVSYNNSNVLYISTSNGEILKSTNAGQFWSVVHRVAGASFVDVVIDPNNSDIIYAATANKGVYKSTDGGLTWLSLSQGLQAFSSGAQYRKLIIDEATANSLILVTKYAIAKSSDAGNKWTIMDLIKSSKNTAITAVGVNPKNSNELYYTTQSTLIKTIDGGKSWSSQKLPFAKTASSIIIDPVDSTTLYLTVTSAAADNNTSNILGF